MGSPFAMARRNPMAMALQSSLAPYEMPPVSSLRDQATKVGRLKKLSGKGILTSGTWRERFCLLVKNKLYYYESQDSPGGTDKSCGFVNLEYFDTCTEASTRMARKATNVFVIGSSDKGFFESHSGRRHYFAAETHPEMKEWVSAINSVMKNHIRKEKRTTRDGSLTPGQTKRDKMKSKTIDSPTGTLPRSEARLDHVTKGRVRGPQGRRLPRKPQRPNGIPDLKDDSVLDSEDEVRDSRGRATSLSALEASSETQTKISIHLTDDERNHSQIQNVGDFDAWDKTDNREDGTDTPDIELIYDYSSSDSNEDSASQLTAQKSLASGGYIQRRPLSRAGSHIRNSSVTPPPCLLRKNRREQENNNNATNSYKHSREDNGDPQHHAPPEFGSLHRASSGSSLSTLTADTYSDISNQNLNGGPFLSLRRNKDKSSNGFNGNTRLNNGAHKQHFPTPTSNMKPPMFQHQRQSSSVQGSPLMSNGHHVGVILHHSIARNGCSSQNSSPNNTFDRNGYLCNGAGTGFQLERNILSLNKDVESISQDTKQLDVDVTGLRQDVGVIQEHIVQVRGAVNGAQEKMNRLQNHVNYVEKQVASIIQEASSLKEQARDMLDSAKNVKELQNSLLEEAQSLVAFLKQSATCVPSSPYLQHFNGHFGQQVCCPSSPVPSYCVHPMPQPQSSPVQLSLRRRGKTPERSGGVEEADMDTLKESVTGGSQQNGCFDSIKSRNTKSALSNSSSSSGRGSFVDPLERKIAGTRSPISNGKLSDCTKISHL